jgi:hypothetical protein
MCDSCVSDPCRCAEATRELQEMEKFNETGLGAEHYAELYQRDKVLDKMSIDELVDVIYRKLENLKKTAEELNVTLVR